MTESPHVSCLQQARHKVDACCLQPGEEGWEILRLGRVIVISLELCDLERSGDRSVYRVSRMTQVPSPDGALQLQHPEGGVPRQSGAQETVSLFLEFIYYCFICIGVMPSCVSM